MCDREEGLKGFWKGLSASYWGCSEGCIQFVVYEKLKKQLIERWVLGTGYCVLCTVGANRFLLFIFLNNFLYHCYSPPILYKSPLHHIHTPPPIVSIRNNEKRRAKGLAESAELPPAYTLGAAAFSKFLATTATYPHEVVRTRYVRACVLT